MKSIALFAASGAPTTDAATALKDQLWWLPILISVLAFATALTALGWQIRSFLLSGARVRVRMVPTLWDPETTRVFSHESRSGAMDPQAGVFYEKVDRIFGVECGLLIVENLGRTAVTISNPGVAYRGARRGFRRGFTRRLHTVSPRLFAQGDARMAKDGGPYRLEAHSSVQYLLDIHSAFEQARGERTGRLKITGCVSQVGRRRTVLAGRSWRMPREAQTLVKFGPRMTVERRIQLEIARDSQDHAKLEGEYFARKLAAKLADLRSRRPLDFTTAHDAAKGSLKTWLSMWEERPIVGMSSYRIANAVVDKSKPLDWRGAEYELKTWGVDNLYEKASADQGRDDTHGNTDGRTGDRLGGGVLPKPDARDDQSSQHGDGDHPDDGKPAEK